MLLDLLETCVSEEETVRIIAEKIINGVTEYSMVAEPPNP